MAASRVTPNMISQASMAFAALGLLAFWASAHALGLPRALALILAAVAVQGRLLCNMIDGMVAVEGGRRSPTGPFWNEAPDRVSDVALLWGLGLAAGIPALGLGAGALAVATAYLRELGRAEGMAPDFGGPMAKPQRMAALTGGSVIAAMLPPGSGSFTVLGATLWIVAAGTALTVLLRARRLLAGLGRR